MYTGQEQDAWLDVDENLSRWEDGKLTASDRRILIAQWYCAAWKRICKEKADTLRKYFEHTGALLTADGTADELIKMEGVPKDKTFSWEDDSLDSIILRGSPGDVNGEAGGVAAATEPEPDDVCPTREAAEADAALGDEELDDEDDEDDETDVPRALRTAPDGWCIVEEPHPLPPPSSPSTPTSSSSWAARSCSTGVPSACASEWWSGSTVTADSRWLAML